MSGTPAWDALQHLVLPGIALGTIPLAIIVRITRASVLDVVNEDYVRTAQAKGLANGHRAPPAHPAQRAAAGVDDDRPADRAAALRRRPHRDGVRLRRGGLDAAATRSAHRDYALLQGFILILAIMYVLVNLLVDISYALLDPRVRVR